jgi:hypothetical protein
LRGSTLSEESSDSPTGTSDSSVNIADASHEVLPFERPQCLHIGLGRTPQRHKLALGEDEIMIEIKPRKNNSIIEGKGNARNIEVANSLSQ